MGEYYIPMHKTWRQHARPIIAETLKKNEGKSEKEIKKALFEAYPYGERKYHPYKIWLSEIRFQLGKTKKKVRGETIDENQLKLI